MGIWHNHIETKLGYNIGCGLNFLKKTKRILRKQL